jgi:glyoxylase I family protein
MTTTEHTSDPATLRPRLTGIQHVGITVTDLNTSRAWYERVLGLVFQFQEPHHRSECGGYAVVLGTPDGAFNLGLDHHPTNRRQPFDPALTGLDHLCFQVSTRAELLAWEARLDAVDVAHSGVYDIDGMPVSLLTFRDPDGVQLELIAFS